MEIKIQLFGKVYSICIGHKTKWFESSYFITIIEEFYNDNHEVEYAKMIIRIFPDRETKKWIKSKKKKINNFFTFIVCLTALDVLIYGIASKHNIVPFSEKYIFLFFMVFFINVIIYIIYIILGGSNEHK